MSVSLLKTEVVEKLSLVTDDDREILLTSLDLTVSTERRKKEKAVYNAIVRYLTSKTVEDLPDEGLSIFQKLNDRLTGMVEEKKADDKVKEEEK